MEKQNGYITVKFSWDLDAKGELGRVAGMLG